MAMDMCASSYDPVVIVEVALRVFHGDLHVGSLPDINEREQENIEDNIISTLHQECLCRGLDPNQWIDQRAMMPRPWSQQKATSSGFGHQDDNENEPEGFYQQERYSRRDGGSQFGWQSRHDQSRNCDQYRRYDQSRNWGYKYQDRPNLKKEVNLTMRIGSMTLTLEITTPEAEAWPLPDLRNTQQNRSLMITPMSDWRTHKLPQDLIIWTS